MKVTYFTLFTLFTLFLSTAYAQGNEETLALSPDKAIVSNDLMCFSLVNRAPYTVHGTLITNYYETQSGMMARHRANFHLETNETNEFCSSGPFYGVENNQLKLVLRTIVPIFSCDFIPQGEIIIYGKHLEEGGTKTWAECNPV